ncbi:MAG TPA: class III extradiol ring-cleavage dioxygenase [Phycisphaerae bacterium]|nr:class III extradiol ring-cleavage dioxygenase [Burkholderiaceae bacterium]HPM25463.1 class III extradiol ring-cleavage dioxygenase [Phycisphaerae bacterium]
MKTVPSLFVSHGAPTFALEPGVAGAALSALGRRLPPLSAVLIVSPHWITTGFRVTSGTRPATIHDFSGFPPALYELQYPAPGDPARAAEIVRLLASAGIDVTLDAQRGLDHGAWVPLRHLLPTASTPVLQLSLSDTLDARGALRLGEALRPLREQGVLVVGSGSLTHNLGEFRGPATEAGYVADFVQWIRQAVAERDTAALVDYRHRAPHAVRSHPTEEHFLPLLVAVGATSDADRVDVIEGGTLYGMLSMESYVFE